MAVVAVLAFGAGLTAIADGDIFWHLAAGREMVRTRAFLHVDPFSLVAAGRLWVDLHWLFQLGVFAVHTLGGLAGLVLVKAAVVAAGAVVLVYAAGRSGGVSDASGAGRMARLICTLALSAMLFAARHLLPVRPVILTLVFLAAFFSILEDFRRGGAVRSLWWLPPLQILWANCQGLFALGPALIGAFVLGALLPSVGDRRWRPLAGMLGLCLLASLVTPYGWRGPWLAVELLLRFDPSSANVYSAQIAENVPPWILERSMPGLFFHLKWFLGFLAASFLLGRRHLIASHAVLVAALVALALVANRNVILLYWLGAPIGAIQAAPALAVLERWLRERGRSVRVAVGAVVAVAVIALAVVEVKAFAREPSLAAPTPFRFPTASAAVLATTPAGGAIFSADHQGGYLIWTLYPRIRPHMDTRLILRTRDEYQDFLDLLDHPERFDFLSQRYRFTHAVLPVGFPGRYLGLIAHLAGSADWKLVFTDGQETLFATRDATGPAVDLADPATTQRLLDGCAARFPSVSDLAASCRVQTATLLVVTGHLALAAGALNGLPGADAQVLLARCHLALGDAAAAETIARRLIDGDPEDTDALTLLASIALARGDGAGALTFVRRALHIDPFHAGAQALLGGIEVAARNAGPPR